MKSDCPPTTACFREICSGGTSQIPRVMCHPNRIFDNPLAAGNLALDIPTSPSSTPQCLLDPPSPIPSSSGDPSGPSYLQIGSLGQCLSIGHATGAQNVEHPRGDHGAAGNCHACPEGGSMKLQAWKRHHWRGAASRRGLEDHMKPFCDHCGQRCNAVGALRRQVFNLAASSCAEGV